MKEMSPETEARALDLLQTPMGALQFFDAFRPEQATRSVGSRSLGGHALLRQLEARGVVVRTRGVSAALDTFQAVDAMNTPPPVPASTPLVELQPLASGEIVEVQRRVVGRLASTPAQPPPADQKLDVENGRLVRTSVVVKKEDLGPAQGWQPPAPPAPPQAPQHVPISEVVGINAMLDELISMPLDAATRPTKLGEIHARMLANSQLPAPPGYQPAMVMQRQMLDQLAAMQPPPQPAPQQQQTVPPTIDPMAMMQAAFQLFQQMQAAVQEQAPDPEPYRAPYRPVGVGVPYQPPPARPKSAAEAFRENITSIRAAASDLQDLGLWSDRSPPEVDEPEESVDPRVIDVGGGYKVVVGPDGSSRFFETAFANVAPVLKAVAEIRERKQQPRQLPPAVDPQQVPQMQAPPIAEPPPAEPAPAQHANGSSPQRRTWDMLDLEKIK